MGLSLDVGTLGLVVAEVDPGNVVSSRAEVEDHWNWALFLLELLRL